LAGTERHPQEVREDLRAPWGRRLQVQRVALREARRTINVEGSRRFEMRFMIMMRNRRGYYRSTTASKSNEMRSPRYSKLATQRRVHNVRLLIN
jgi:hypothetical protein